MRRALEEFYPARTHYSLFTHYSLHTHHCSRFTHHCCTHYSLLTVLYSLRTHCTHYSLRSLTIHSLITRYSLFTQRAAPSTAATIQKLPILAVSVEKPKFRYIPESLNICMESSGAALPGHRPLIAHQVCAQYYTPEYYTQSSLRNLTIEARSQLAQLFFLYNIPSVIYLLSTVSRLSQVKYCIKVLKYSVLSYSYTVCD